MNVQEVIVGGESLPISFNMKALFSFTKASGVSLSAIDSLGNQDPEILEELFYQGLKEGHRLTKKKLKIQKEDVLAVSAQEFEQYTKALELSMSATPIKKKQGKTNIKIEE